MKVAELEGVKLDYWVAMALRYEADFAPPQHPGNYLGTDGWFSARDWQPSVRWSDGGPIIERERIELLSFRKDEWEAQLAPERARYIDQSEGDAMRGPTPLVAAMRAFVESRFGDEVGE